MPAEPVTTAFLLTIFGLLLAVSILFSPASARAGVPLTLIFLGIGMLAGSGGVGGVAFDDYPLAFRLGTAALVLILFDGGLNTPLASVREAVRPAGVLATVGVAGTAGLVAFAAHLLGFTWPLALLLGAVVSSTDAATVFAVLRGSGIQLKRRVGLTLEIESGVNDPMAVILTTLLTRNLLTPGALQPSHAVLGVALELALGLLFGLGIGHAARWVLMRVRLHAAGLYPLFTLAVAFLAFGVPTLVGGSGFLAVYVAALVLGDAPLPYRAGLLRVHDAAAWLSQIAMFLTLGLLIDPPRLREVARVGLGLALFLAVVARPLVVALCLLPFHFPLREIAYVGWVGLRGAVPIVLATVPVLARAPGAEPLFDLVFFIVVVNAIVQGGTVSWLTRRLGLESREPPSPRAVLEITSLQPVEGELLSFYVDEALVVSGMPLAELPFPEGAAATLIVRGSTLIAPKESTTLQPGDHVYVVTSPQDRPFIQLMFGRPEGD